MCRSYPFIMRNVTSIFRCHNFFCTLEPFESIEQSRQLNSFETLKMAIPCCPAEQPMNECTTTFGADAHVQKTTHQRNARPCLICSVQSTYKPDVPLATNMSAEIFRRFSEHRGLSNALARPEHRIRFVVVSLKQNIEQFANIEQRQLAPHNEY